MQRTMPVTNPANTFDNTEETKGYSICRWLEINSVITAKMIITSVVNKCGKLKNKLTLRFAFLYRFLSFNFNKNLSI